MIIQNCTLQPEDECTNCDNGFFSATPTLCSPCLPGCNECDGRATCRECKEGWFKTEDGGCIDTWPEDIPCDNMEQCTKLAKNCEVWKSKDCIEGLSETSPEYEACWNTFIQDYSKPEHMFKLYRYTCELQDGESQQYFLLQAKLTCKSMGFHPRLNSEQWADCVYREYTALLD